MALGCVRESMTTRDRPALSTGNAPSIMRFPAVFVKNCGNQDQNGNLGLKLLQQ
jgi:hypothetical protein